MSAYEHEGLRVDVDEGVAFVTLDHPPVNLFDAALIGSLWDLAGELPDDEAVRAVVVRSADPEFFIAHADLGLIQALPRNRRDRPEQLEFIHVFMERWRTLPQVTIAQLEGRARGGGSEFALSLDLRFGAIGRTTLCQPEVAVGILPGGSGSQRLPRLMGRARALEVYSGAKTSTPSSPSATAGSTAPYRLTSSARSSSACRGASQRSQPVRSGSRSGPSTPPTAHSTRACSTRRTTSTSRSPTLSSTPVCRAPWPWARRRVRASSTSLV